MALPKHGKKHVGAWQASGLTQAAYCRQAGLNAKNLSRWIRNYPLASESAAPRLVPVGIKPNEVPRAAVTVVPRPYVGVACHDFTALAG